MLRIATRRSPLAQWQAEHVAALLRERHQGLQTELLTMVTTGDRLLGGPLSSAGGKGLFVKELEQALLDGRAEIAVHSMKDVPAQFPPGLGIGAILEREDPRDALLGSSGLEALAAGASVGTASQRRGLQLLARRPDLRLGMLRGNINTRMAKLDAGEFDAIVLAAAGLKRLGFAQRIDAVLSTEVSLPAIGQGALGIECRLDDASTRRMLQPLHHEATARCLAAERAFGAQVGGNCQLPIAAHAELTGSELYLRALIGLPDGSRTVRGEARGADPLSLGEKLAAELLDSGGREILHQLAADPA